MTAEGIMELYQTGQPFSPASWLADPLQQSDASRAASFLQDLARSSNLHGRENFNRSLARMIVHYWVNGDADMDYRTLAATARDIFERARLELCFGQLLLARKRTSAWRHLDAGFALAAKFLEPEEYFLLLNRHERLRHLVLSPSGSVATDLDSLLKEAEVIRQLRGVSPNPKPRVSEHNDTLG